MLRSPHPPTPQTAVSPLASSERPLVLVVDPDHSARAVLEVALSRDGFDVWSVETAEQGLGVLRRGRTPEVIVLESKLRSGDGFSFCAELRGNARTAQVPVVLLAHPDDQNVANLAEVVGVDEYVQKPAFARDVAALVRFELVRHRVASGHPLRFHTRHLPAAHLMRALLTSARTGSFSLANGAASVAFREGQIVQARFGERWGVDALVRALALTFHDYTVTLAPVSVSTDFRCSLRDFVALVLPRLTRWNTLTMRSLPLDAVLAVDFARLAQALPSLPDEVNRIVRLFDGRRSVKDVLVDSAFDEALTLEVGTRLYLMGVIGPVTSGDLPELPRQAPKLFEPRSAEAEELMRQLFDGTVEIRASDVEPAAVAQSDWAMVGVPSDLEAEDPAGGWTAAALPDAHLFDGLSPDAAKKLEAFPARTEVEVRERPAAEVPVAQFAQGALSDEGHTLEGAFQSATGDAAAVLRDLPGAESDPDPTPPSPARRFSPEDRQERVITPVLTPAVLPLPEGPASAEPARAGAAQARSPGEVDPEALFFGSQAEAADPGAFEDTFPAHTAPLPRAKRSRVGLVVGLTLVAVLFAVGVEWSLQRAPVRNVAEAPVAAAVVEPIAPVPLPVAAVEPVVEEPVPETTIDVSQPLADGVVAYQRGEYKKAIAVLEQVVADEPTSVQGWLVLGQARYDGGDPAGARVAAERVLKLDPRNARVHVLLATLAHDANDKNTMRAELERYLELEPNGEHAAEARALLSGR